MSVSMTKIGIKKPQIHLFLLNKKFNFFTNSNSKFPDPRTKDWFLMSSIWPLLTLIPVYLLFVKVILPKYMEKRKPFDLKGFLIACYNISMIIGSSLNFYSVKSTKKLQFRYSLHFLLTVG